MGASEVLCSLARKGLSKIAARELKAKGPRKDSGLLSAGCYAAVSGEVAAGNSGDHL